MIIDYKRAEAAIEELLAAMGVDSNKEPYLGTPSRYVGFLEEMFGESNNEIKTFPEQYAGIISLKNHEVWSLCPHHLLPVVFIVDVTYKPKGVGRVQVLGLSKLPRLIDEVVREGPALQERMTQRIVDLLIPYSDYVNCTIRGEHLCTKIRGVKTAGMMQTAAIFKSPSVPHIATVN